jgi:hypothetical protein
MVQSRASASAFTFLLLVGQEYVRRTRDRERERRRDQRIANNREAASKWIEHKFSGATGEVVSAMTMSDKELDELVPNSGPNSELKSRSLQFKMKVGPNSELKSRSLQFKMKVEK